MRSRRACVELRRGGVVESRHHVSAALVDESGQLLAWAGDPELVTYARSSAKPFQALPLVADGVADAFEMTDVELALCCASHSSEPEHVKTVMRLLGRIDCSEEDLECGPHEPFHAATARALRSQGRMPTKFHSNCSGKHTGMLAWARHKGIETKGYARADHPVQQRIRTEISAWTGTRSETMKSAIDGCGVVTYALPLNALAGAYAKLVGAAKRDSESAAARVTGAMTGNPYFVGGTGRLVTQIMEASGGRILAKDGAEGVMCLADRERCLGLALKVEDGQKRAVAPAAVEFLAQTELLAEGELSALDDHHVGTVENTLGEIVAEVRANYLIERSD